MPLALYDWQTVGNDEGVSNYFVLADKLPDLDNLPEELPHLESTPTGKVFHYDPTHRWYYFPNMTADEVILLKLHDSDHSRAWRAPHTAIRDPSVAVFLSARKHRISHLCVF